MPRIESSAVYILLPKDLDVLSILAHGKHESVKSEKR
ncbi:hypothetical protein A1F94_003730 [Pyrenophora tritici-repentis]|uniref:Uncharacterized protein n=1 Tax=Pyrenophora tritici-repentis TaxID=45151 RepID=A0A834S1G5_9PLEO|nr:hypothetical protein A1F99_044290 [Pyrenophora tritici-repentis]KAF7574211.1 hypothetical protein PtrM4_058340 [Pyrenophora tritici-repentis]KAG9386980.1 hypothetical protein A1F94_003730 [Pyrenophora tritici-repentis]KAI0578396.1 hypothetical protein Alg130_07970 [Pyrenophora tritici-repentis]